MKDNKDRDEVLAAVKKYGAALDYLTVNEFL